MFHLQSFPCQFYHRLLNSSEEIRRRFENTDLDRQARVLDDSLYIVTVAAQAARPSEEVSPNWAEMSRLARLHDRDHLDIRPGLYDLWLA